jgi:signal transduction histidine kinase
VGAKNSQTEYRPTVTISTSSLKPPSGGLGVKISVKDNGPGIPSEIKDKIFQPFFTTKPTGSGTGLGLSLSYDIVKAHGGSLDFNSELGKGTQFIISLKV